MYHVTDTVKNTKMKHFFQCRLRRRRRVRTFPISVFERPKIVGATFPVVEPRIFGPRRDGLEPRSVAVAFEAGVAEDGRRQRHATDDVEVNHKESENGLRLQGNEQFYVSNGTRTNSRLIVA